MTQHSLHAGIGMQRTREQTPPSLSPYHHGSLTAESLKCLQLLERSGPGNLTVLAQMNEIPSSREDARLFHDEAGKIRWGQVVHMVGACLAC